ncbi:MAG: transposase [Candidatus Omnitrophota bacterium]
MNKKFYSRKQNRLPTYDYSENGYYYITVCTHNQQELFGSIENDKMILNEYGKIIKDTWLKIPAHFTNVDLDEYIIMSNHIHGIIQIVGARLPRPNEDINDNVIGRGNPAPTLGQIIAYFKYKSTKQINESRSTPGRKIWQRNYYDHVIRNDKSLSNIREYIVNNPLTWGADENNPMNYKITVQAGLPTGRQA